MDRAINLVERYKTPLLPVAETKFKIARIAAGLSALAYSRDEQDRCFVSNESVDMAWSLLDGYKNLNITERTSSGGEVPEILKTILDQLPANEVTRLRSFIVQDMMTMSELKDLFGPSWTVQFIQTAFYEMNLMKRRRSYFMWDSQLREYMERYINERPSKDTIDYPYETGPTTTDW